MSRRPPRSREEAQRATASPFSRRTVVTLAVLGGVAFALYLGYMVFGPDPESAGDGSSMGGHRSAVGYRTLLQLLEGEVPVRQALGQRPGGLSDTAPLLVLEPGRVLRPTLADTLDHANNAWAPMVVVLPKWVATPHSLNPGWAGELILVPESEPAEVAREALTAILDSEEVYLSEQKENAAEVLAETEDESEAAANREWAADVERQIAELEAVREAVPELSVTRSRTAEPVTAEVTFGTEPETWTAVAHLGQPQLLVDPSGLLQPVVAFDEGLAVARLPNLPVYLVADPDLWNVAGLPRGDNALIAVGLLVDELGAEEILVKEGRHGGLRGRRSLWSALLRPPLAWVTLHAALVALVAVWIAASRFGRPRAAPPRVPPGKRTLVENTARLLSEAGDPGSAVERYLGVVVERTADALALPPGLEGDERLRRLERLGRQRGARRPLRALAAAVGDLPARGAPRRQRALELARELYAWHRETLGHDPRGSAATDTLSEKTNTDIRKTDIRDTSISNTNTSISNTNTSPGAAGAGGT